METKNLTKLNRKANQCQVMEIASRPLVYRVKSPSGSTYTVDLNTVSCSCPWAGTGCSHELAARKFHARKHGRTVSFQSGDAAEVAKAQHKRAVPIAPNSAMVIRDKVKAPKPEPAPKAPRIVKVAFLWNRMEAPDEMDAWLVNDVFVRNGNGWRKSTAPNLDDLLDSPGWTATAPKMVRGNERPGWHRYEFEMVEG